MIVTVKTSLAVICFLGQCYPALVGEDTPVGTYSLNKRIVLSEGYGGDVLQFQSDGNKIYAIHRPYSLDRKRNREKILDEHKEFRFITKGCINVSDSIYNFLFKNSKRIKLVIEEK